MQKRMNRFFSGLLALSFFVVAGCQQASDDSSSTASTSTEQTSSAAATASVDLNMDLAAVFNKASATTASSQSKFARFTTENLTATLVLTDTTNSSNTSTHSLRMSLNDESWDVQALSTLIFTPGSYDFTLTVSDSANHTYRGTATSTIVDGTNDVAMTIAPIIGDTELNVNVQNTLSDFKIQYPAVELSTVAAPRLGVSVDGGSEVIFDLTSDGSSSVYLNLTPGDRNIKLQLYNGSNVIGKSITSQEDQTVVTSQNITMDLVPLYGETTFSLDVTTGDATFDFKVPAAIAEEAGGLANLVAHFRYSSPKNTANIIQLSLVEDGTGDHVATANLPLNYDSSFDTSLTFTDDRDDVVIGFCENTGLTIDSTTRNLTCNVTLHKRAELSGNVKAVVGINVFDIGGAPRAGATVTVDGQSMGVTGTASAFTPGYLKVYMTQGSHIIRATLTDGSADTVFGETTKTVSALEIANYDIDMDDSP